MFSATCQGRQKPLTGSQRSSVMVMLRKHYISLERISAVGWDNKKQAVTVKSGTRVTLSEAVED